ncbi:MAG: hypothetical protein GC189_07640 [Alphaproteobacteria bacterium]|nr:hypothetical protein [Alphaproteobacteria bacterium]
MTILRGAIGIGGLILLGLILWASFALKDLHGGFFDQFAVVSTLPWGVVALVDLYLGFFLFAVLVLMVERSLIRAALWALPIFVLGNIWAAVWFVLRLPYLADRLTMRGPPSA